jgi:hypothetical protein
MYDYLLNYILQLITTVCTKLTYGSSESDFTRYHLAHLHAMIHQHQFYDEYIRKFSTYDVLSR